MERASDYPNLVFTQWLWDKNSNRDCTQLVLLLTLEPPPALKACLGFVLSWSVMPLASACTTLPLRCLLTWSSAMSWLAALWRPLADQAPRGWARCRMFVTRGIPENAYPKTLIRIAHATERTAEPKEKTKGEYQKPTSFWDPAFRPTIPFEILGSKRPNLILGSRVSP